MPPCLCQASRQPTALAQSPKDAAPARTQAGGQRCNSARIQLRADVRHARGEVSQPVLTYCFGERRSALATQPRGSLSDLGYQERPPPPSDRRVGVIKRVQIENFRCLKQVDVALRPLTVLVGPNDSGKTTFLEAVLSRLSHPNFPPANLRRELPAARVVILRERNNVFEGSVGLFRLPSEGIAMKSPGVADDPKTGAPRLDRGGANIAALMDYLLRKDRKRFEAIQAALRLSVPGFEEIRIGVPTTEDRSLSWVINGGLEISGERLSTGARIIFFFLTLAHHPSPPDVILVEEPENGVHPRRLREIVELLRALTQDKAGAPRQVILTTHSPYLLDQVRLPEDQIIVFRREDDGNRTAGAVNAEGLKTFLDEFMLGEVWFNQGEEGLLAATR